MAKFIPKTYPQIQKRMIHRVVARTKLSDLTDTSVLKHILAAVAREVDDAYFQMGNKLNAFSIDKAHGEDLDERAKDYNPDAIARREAVGATGNLVFTRVTPNPGGPITIPAGTQVEVPGESPAIVAVTTAAGTINNGGTTTGNVAAVMVKTGTRGNVAAAQLTKFKGAKPSGVDAVSNPSAFVGGVDKETDDAFRERLRAFARSRAKSTVAALEFAATEVALASGQRVVFAKAVEDPITLGYVTLYIDDGTGSAESTAAAVVNELLTSGAEFPGNVAQGGEQYLYLDAFPVKSDAAFTLRKNGVVQTINTHFKYNPANGQVYMLSPLAAGDTVHADYTPYNGLIAEVQKVIDGDPADRTNYPGWRAAGTRVVVDTPAVVNFTMTANMTAAEGYDQSIVAADARTAIAAYVNGLGIGRDIIIAEIIERAMAVEGMFDFQMTAPVANVVILDDQLPRVDDAAADITLT